MYSDEQLSWLFFEGLVPVFGAGIIFLLYGGCRYMVGATAFSWKAAIDPQGLLFFGFIIPIQAAFRSPEAKTPQFFLGVFCIFCATLCGLLLIAAMAERGGNLAWRAPTRLKVGSFFLIVVIITAGYAVQAIPK